MKFSFDLDQILINHVSGRGMTNRKWQRVAELTGCVVDVSDCRARWDLIRNHANVEYKCLIPGSGAASASDQARSQPMPTPSLAPESEPGVSINHVITIHVRDEARQISRDFACGKTLLLSDMSYFQHHLHNCSSADHIDISVHCDVHIFDWLMKYVKGEPRPQFDPKTVVSILISSDFLQMPRLVGESIQYFVQRASDIVHIPIDLTCINDNLVDQLASAFAIEQLHRLQDPSDKILSRLCRSKLKHLLESASNQLFVCSLCASLFTASQHAQVACHNAKIGVDVHGAVIARHQRDHQQNWDANMCIGRLRADGVSWCEIFWRFWAIVTTLTCSKCGRFRICDFGHCRYHGCDPTFAPGSDSGRYRCCKAAILRFDTIDAAIGCRAMNHAINSTNDDRVSLEIMLDRPSTILIPFSPDSNDLSLLCRLGLQSTLHLTSKLVARTTMLREGQNRPIESTIEQLVLMHRSDFEFAEAEFRTGGDDDGLVLSDDSSDDSVMNPLQVLGSASGSDDETSQATLSRTSSKSCMKKTNITFHRRHARKKTSKSTSSASKSSATSSPARHRVHLLDSLRDDDRARMHSLVHKLADMRSDQCDDRAKHARAGLAMKHDPIRRGAV